MAISIRLLEDADFEAADTILKLAFRSSVSRIDDLRLYRHIQPDGWFVASQEEGIVGTVGATNYGTFAHVGLMAVHPEVQRRGIGLALMQFILAKLEQRQITQVWLDASEMGRPLYEKLGFVAQDETLVFQRNTNSAIRKSASHSELISVHELDELVQLDTDIFGADRRNVFQALLDTFPGRAFAQRDAGGRLIGYIFAQKNRIGPWASQSGEGEALLQAVLALPYQEPFSVAVPSVNREAIDLLQSCGFERVRANRHMGRKVNGDPGKRQTIYAETSLALG